MGQALCIGLSFQDFCALTPGEYAAACSQWSELHESEERGRWERMRLLAAFFVQPYSKKKITPRGLLPLPWDKDDEKPRMKNEKLQPKEVITHEERERRKAAALKKVEEMKNEKL